jgi:hypothetical protein
MMKKINLTTPDDWNDITLNQYKMLLKVQSETIIENELDLYKLRTEQVLILNPHVEKDDILRLSLEQLSAYFKAIEFLDKEPVKKEQKELKIDGKKYIFSHFKNLSLEQWIDAEKYSSIEDAHKLIAIFYIKPIEYDEVELDKVSDWLDKQPAHVAFWTISQFFFIQKALELGTNLYLEQMTKKAEKVKRVIEISRKIDARLRQFGSRFYMTSRSTTSKK